MDFTNNFYWPSGLIKKNDSCRIINVSSMAHEWTRNLDTEDLNFKKMSYGQSEAYAQTKICNVLFTLALADKFSGTG